MHEYKAVKRREKVISSGRFYSLNPMFSSARSLLVSSSCTQLDDVGASTKEIRIKDASGIYRVMFVAKFEEAIYVLYCFPKKTQTTSKEDKAIAEARYRAVANTRKVQK